MDLSFKKSVHSDANEDRNAVQSHINPFFFAHHQDVISYQEVQFSSPGNSTTMDGLMPPSPQSPWTLSPLRSPSPSLVYHCIASLHRHEGNIYSIALSKGIVFTGSESNRIRVWRQPDCIEKGYVKASSGEVRAILAHGNMLFSAHKDHRIRIWNFTFSDNFRTRKVSTLPKRKSLTVFQKSSTQYHKDCLSCMAYYQAEGLLYTGSFDRTVKVWRILDKKCVDSFVAHEDIITGTVVNQDDGCVFTCSFDGSVKVWRRVYRENSHTLIMTLKFHLSPVNALALSLSLNNCYLYSGSSDGTINIWEKETLSGRFNHCGFLQGHRFAVLCLVAVEKLIFSGSEDTTIKVWKREEGSHFHKCIAVLDGHRGPVRCMAVCLEMEKVVLGFLVYSASLDQTFKVWRVKVLPGENMSFDLDNNEQRESRTKAIEYETSPVLSPSWVKKKLKGSRP